MAYTPKPAAVARRAALDGAMAAGLAAMNTGRNPTPEQVEAVRNAYRTACRAEREGVRSANTAKQMALKCRIEDARLALAAAGTAPVVQVPTAATVAPALDPFTGVPFEQVALTQNFVL